MATADEILAGAVEVASEVVTEDKVLRIDNELRTISIPSAVKLLGVESDEDVNVIEFEMPRYYGEFDLSEFSVRVNYLNANNEGDIYKITDLSVGEQTMTFSWLVGRHATEYKGTVQFIVCLKKLTEEFIVEKEFNTTVHKLTVLEGLEIELTEEEEAKVRDVLAQLLSLIEAQKDEAIEAVKTEGASQISAISTSGVEQMQAITNTGKEQKAAIEAAGEKELAAIKAVGADQLIADLNAAGNAQQSAIENKAANALASIPEDYTALYNRAVRNTDTKADAIIDTSAKAASHTLYAQDAPMHVTLYGQTYQAGSGDPSPDNVRPISGVDTAKVHCGGKNLIDIAQAAQRFENFNGAEKGWGSYADGIVTIKVNLGAHGRAFMAGQTVPVVAGVSYTVSADVYFPAGATNLKPTLGIAEKYKSLTAVAAAETWERVSWTSVATKTESARVVCMGGSNDMQFKNLQVEIGSIATPYEPYNANILDMTDELNGEALYGNGTVMDTVENDVPSGCDKTYTFNGTEQYGPFNSSNWNTCAVFYTSKTLSDIQGGFVPYSDRFSGRVVATSYTQEYVATHDTLTTYMYFSVSFERLGIDPTKDTAIADAAFKAYLAANPLTVYYRSTAYTSEKDLRVCKVVRRVKKVECSKVDSEHSNIAGLFKMVVPSGYGSSGFQDRCNIFKVSTAAWADIADMCVRYISHNDARFKWTAMAGNIDGVNAYLAEHPLEITLPITTPEVYYTDHIELRKPVGLKKITVTGSGETEVAYVHDTRHYIDSQIAAVVALAMNG